MAKRWLILGTFLVVIVMFVLEAAGLHQTASAGLFALGALFGYYAGTQRKSHRPSGRVTEDTA